MERLLAGRSYLFFSRCILFCALAQDAHSKVKLLTAH